jgi:LysM domain
MTAMRAVELPEGPAAGLPEIPAALLPEESAADRAAVRWTLPGLPPTTAAPDQASGSPAARQLPSRRQPASVPLRLTRRGRIVVAVMTAVLLAALSLVITRSAEATSQPGPARAAQGLTEVIVHPGQSLWSVAENADPDADTRVVIQQIVKLNGLTGAVVFAGQRLRVPRG